MKRERRNIVSKHYLKHICNIFPRDVSNISYFAIILILMSAKQRIEDGFVKKRSDWC